MLIGTFTPKEEQQLRLLREKHKIELLNTTDKKEQLRLRIQFSEDLARFIDQCQKDRFNKLGGDPEAILADAKDTAGEIINQQYNELLSHSTAEELKGLNIVSVINGKVYINTNFIADVLQDEFKLHIDALHDDPKHLQQLYSYIIDAIEASDVVKGGEIDIAGWEKPNLEIMRYRRSPLRDIHTYGLMNDNTSTHMLQEGEIFQTEADGQLVVRWAVPQAKPPEPIMTLLALSYEGTDGKITRKLTAFDKAVYEAVATRFYYWKLDNDQKPLYITPQEVWRTMNGKRSGDGKAKPSQKQVQRICNSLDKMRFTRVYMDITKEIEAFKLHINDERIASGEIDDYLLNSSKVTFMTDKGNKVEGYRLTEEPIIYTYNSIKGHLLFVPYDLLDTSANTSDSENVTEFRNYLLQQIQLMKNAKEGKGKFKRNNIILISTIYEGTGILPPEERANTTSSTSDNARQTYIRKTRKADREKIEGILDAWKDKKWIKDYDAINGNDEKRRAKQQVKGYRIYV